MLRVPPPCGVVCAAALSLMYSSMHPLRGRVNRVERTLLNFFVWSGVRGGYFGALGQCFTGKIGAAARREWAVLPRNSGVLGGVWARGGDSAHGGHERANWAKNFLKIFKKRGGKPGNWGARGVGRRSEGTLYRVCEAIVRRDS